MTAIKPRSARVVIYQGDDLERLSDLDDAVTRAETALRRAETATKAPAAPRALHEVGHPQAALHQAQERHTEAKAERDVFAAEAESRRVVVVLHAQPRRMWRELMRDHGPREGVKDDEALGVNMESLPDTLLPISIDREQSTIEGDTVDFLEALSDYDYYDRLFLTAFALNRGAALADPTQRLGFAPSQTSAATSN